MVVPSATDIEIVKMVLLALLLIVMSYNVYSLTALVIDLIVKISRREGRINYSDFAARTTLLFLGGYLLHFL